MVLRRMQVLHTACSHKVCLWGHLVPVPVTRIPINRGTHRRCPSPSLTTIKSPQSPFAPTGLGPVWSPRRVRSGWRAEWLATLPFNNWVRRPPHKVTLPVHILVASTGQLRRFFLSTNGRVAMSLASPNHARTLVDNLLQGS